VLAGTHPFDPGEASIVGHDGAMGTPALNGTCAPWEDH